MNILTAQRLRLMREISELNAEYANELMRENASRAHLEAFAGRLLKRAGELYSASTIEAEQRALRMDNMVPHKITAPV